MILGLRISKEQLFHGHSNCYPEVVPGCAAPEAEPAGPRLPGGDHKVPEIMPRRTHPGGCASGGRRGMRPASNTHVRSRNQSGMMDKVFTFGRAEVFV